MSISFKGIQTWQKIKVFLKLKFTQKTKSKNVF